MARKCMFCEGRVNSKEHAWPAWALEWVDNGLPSTVKAQFGGRDEVHVWHDEGVTVKHVCKIQCNTGWMSSLESISRPILRPLMSDLTLPLDTVAQVIAAIWTVKTAMVFEGTGPRDHWFYTQQERTRLMSSATAPTNTLIWAGRNANSGSLYALARRMSNPVPVRNNAFSEGYVGTIGMGRLVLQILSVRSDADHDMTRIALATRPGPWRETLVRIWPTQYPRVVWPPPRSFSSTGTTLDALAERFLTRR
jgi:hypothetical protein